MEDISQTRNRVWRFWQYGMDTQAIARCMNEKERYIERVLNRLMDEHNAEQVCT